MKLSSFPQKIVTEDANSAVAKIAHALSDVVVIYPITPSSPMGESADAFTAAGRENIWGAVPDVVEMQSEGGAAGAVHGVLTTGALSTTFTASQGLLLMIPNMFKIAGELTPTVFHVAARAIATHGLSIFGDHSDVMAARMTGWAMLCSNTPQEAADFALISHAATLKARLPFMHFFDGFRTSHEVQKIEAIPDEVIRGMIDEADVLAHRARGLSPERPVIRGTAQNPDVFFQGREASNGFYSRCPGIVEDMMRRLEKLTGRAYQLYEYCGDPEATEVIVMMGSGAEAMQEVIEHENAAGNTKAGLVKVRLWRPLDVERMIAALPASVQRICVLDRCKESGSVGEPLYCDVQTAIREVEKWNEAGAPLVVGGRYGLGSKEFHAGMAKGVLDNLMAAAPRNHFSIGIQDDVSGTSLDYDPDYSSEPADVYGAMFYGLGSDGTVGANKNTIKIIGSSTDFQVQAYFVYDSKKAGSMTVSHLRFSKETIRSTYLIRKADFVACHSFPFIERFEMLENLKQGGIFLLNSPYPAEAVWEHLPQEVQEEMIRKQARFYVIDAYGLARSIGLGGRINMVMQAAFFAISGVLDTETAMQMMEEAIHKTYGVKGHEIVNMNIRAARSARERLGQVALPSEAGSGFYMRSPVPSDSPAFVRDVLGEMIAMRGDGLPVSAMPADGTYPVGTARFEKRNIAVEIPVWDVDACIQCNQCAMVCPHACIRPKQYDAEYANGSSPYGWKFASVRGKGNENLRYTLQVAPEDCTGCAACVYVCPAFAKDEDGKKTTRKAINMMPQAELRESEAVCWDYFLSIPEMTDDQFNRFSTKGSQFAQPLFEFSGACAGCGETPYVKLLTQLFGDRLLVANATGCSSIYSGNLPTTPYTTDANGRGPAWSNSLFEDAAEFGFGMRLTTDQFELQARNVLRRMNDHPLRATMLEAVEANPRTPADIALQRERVEQIRKDLKSQPDAPGVSHVIGLLDHLVPRSVWVIGGDGWAYDIGFGGLDHVLSSGRNINVLVLDTGVYSNTGGQASKATPRGAIAKFASSGKAQARKDLGAIAISAGGVYVAQIAYGANMSQTVRAMQEAEAYDGPSLVIAYSHCIAHGINMTKGTDVQKHAVECGFWPLYRYNPAKALLGGNPFEWDSKPPTRDLADFYYEQGRFSLLKKSDPATAETLLDAGRSDVAARLKFFTHLAD